ncbi:MAG: HEPN domain-containing protein [Promethearchaeota archaeon]
MHKNEVDLLINRSKAFLDAAKERLKKMNFDLACFMAEQGAQLFLKAILLESSGEFSRTHSIRELIAMIEFLTNQEISMDRNALAFLESAYINSRYLSFLYSEEDAKNAIKTAEEVIKIVEDIRAQEKKARNAQEF